MHIVLKLVVVFSLLVGRDVGPLTSLDESPDPDPGTVPAEPVPHLPRAGRGEFTKVMVAQAEASFLLCIHLPHTGRGHFSQVKVASAEVSFLMCTTPASRWLRLIFSSQGCSG